MGQGLNQEHCLHHMQVLWPSSPTALSHYSWVTLDLGYDMESAKFKNCQKVYPIQTGFLGD